MTISQAIYYLGYQVDKLYKTHFAKALPHPVISIGNITLGGTGKTPTVISLAKWLQASGYYPIILTRGYKGKAQGPCVVTDCANAVRLFGDEPVMMLRHLNSIPIIKCADRYLGGLFALKHLSLSNKKVVFVLDDAFQHYKLKRDIDIVLIDGARPLKELKLLPVGRLREPLQSLSRAHMLVITKQDNIPLRELLHRYAAQTQIFFASYSLEAVKNFDNTAVSLETLKAQSLYAFCAVANPEFFSSSLRQVGLNVVGLKAFRDHHCYSLDDLQAVAKSARLLGAQALITTDKDIVKIQNPPRDILLLYTNAILTLSDDFYNALSAMLAKTF